MTTEKTFKASNGHEIRRNHGYFDEREECYAVRDSDDYLWHSIRQDALQALREFFQYERDQQLGRTRWPENPNYVIYREESEDDKDGRYVRVVNESKGISIAFWEKLTFRSSQNHDRAALWFFTEGPGKEPERPWEQAKVGEVWRLTVEGREGNALVKEAPSGNLYFYSIKDTTPLRYAGITAGRKILNADGSHANE